ATLLRTRHALGTQLPRPRRAAGRACALRDGPPAPGCATDRAVRTLAWSVSAALAVMLAGCVRLARWLPAPEPMRSIAWPQRAAGPARCLVVFLPGLGDDADDFE